MSLHARIDTPSYFDQYGPLIIGTMVNVFGFGLFSFQALLYFERSSRAVKKSRGYQLLVLLVLLLNFGQTVADCSRSVKLTTVHPDDIEYFLIIRNRPEEFISPCLTLIINTIAQLFLIRRCIQFAAVTCNPASRGTAKHRVRVWGVAGFLSVGVAFSFGSGLGVVISLWRLGNLLVSPILYDRATKLTRRRLNADVTSDTGRAFHHLSVLWLGSSAALDICLCGVIVWQLKRAMRGVRDTSKFIGYISRLVFQGGIAVTALQIAALAAYLRTTSSWCDFPTIFISKVYSITLVASISNPYRASGEPLASEPPVGPPSISMLEALSSSSEEDWSNQAFRSHSLANTTLPTLSPRPRFEGDKEKRYQCEQQEQGLSVCIDHGQDSVDSVGSVEDMLKESEMLELSTILGEDPEKRYSISKASMV